MAWTTPRTYVAGEIVTAAMFNTERDNQVALRAGGLAIASQAALDFLYATSATQLGRVAVGTALQVARVNAGVTAYEFALPAWRGTSESFTLVELTTDAPATPNVTYLYRDTLVKAWAAITNSGTPTIADDVNVASLTDNGTGDVTVTFASALASANYAAVVSASNTSLNARATVHSRGTGSVRVLTTDSSGNAGDADFTAI